MSKNLFYRTLLFWVLFIPVAILNGVIRNSFYQPLVGNLLGHQISSLTFSITFLLYSYIFVRTYKKSFKKHELLKVGLIWLILTIMFEFGFGHYVAGHPWKTLLLDYNIFKGRLWAVVLTVITFSPCLVSKLKK